jgi:hypothetical protein
MKYEVEIGSGDMTSLIEIGSGIQKHRHTDSMVIS